MNGYRKWAAGVRWTARILGGMILGLFLVFGVGEGLSFPAPSLTSAEITAAVFVGMMLAGTIIAYWRIGGGCALIILGYAGFTICDGDWNLDNPFVAFPVLATLYGISWLLGRRAA